MLRDAAPEDWPAVLALNAQWLRFLSPLDLPRLTCLARAAFYFRVAEEGGDVAGFFLGFRRGAEYDGEIFQGFHRGDGDFLYMDRLVIGTPFQGRGLANAFYDDVIARARDAGLVRLVCEVDVAPPNEISLRLHARRGFREIGRTPVRGGTKTVALLELDLSGREI